MDDSTSSQGPKKESESAEAPSLREQLAEEQKKNRNLQSKCDSLWAANQKLMAAVVESRRILQSGYEDAVVQEVLTQLETADL
jgi:hypothetical protein